MGSKPPSSQLSPSAGVSPLPTLRARAAQAHPAPTELQLGWSPDTQMSPPMLPQSPPPRSHLLPSEDRVSPALWPLAGSVAQGTGHFSSQTFPFMGCDGSFSPRKADALPELGWEFG